ncbi:MAG: hypothetical protein HQ575_05470 [Candidatus Omnitrophica bacterium]|nr:hypothetical protein [Candidatus Omnitrophota bacterium]
MKKKHMEMAITGAAVIALLIILANTFMSPEKNATKSSSEELDSQKGKPADNKSADVAAKDKDWGRDPFGLEKLPEEESVVSFVLNGIIWDEDNPYAIINDEVVREGDKIRGYKVIEIKEGSVLLDDGTERFSLDVWQ